MITGAASGIGYALALETIENGSRRKNEDVKKESYLLSFINCYVMVAQHYSYVQCCRHDHRHVQDWTEYQYKHCR